MEDLKRKCYLLRTWGGDSSLDNTIREWEKLREQILSHREMFEHQVCIPYEFINCNLPWKKLV